MGNKGRMKTDKPSPTAGKVAAEPSEGVSVSRNQRTEFQK